MSGPDPSNTDSAPWNPALGPIGLRRFFLKRMVRKAPYPQGILDGDGSLLYANAALAALLGSRPFTGTLNDAELRALRTLLRPEAGGGAIAVELDREDGSTAPLTLRIDHHWKLGKSFLLTCWDRSDAAAEISRHAERADQYRSVLGRANDVLLWLGADGAIMGANDRAKLIFGERILGVQVTTLIDAQDVERTQAALHGAREAGGSIALRELRLQSAQRNHNVVLDARLQEGRPGEAPFLLIGNSVNHLVSKTRRLRRSSDRHQQIFQSSLNAMLLVDMAGPHIAEANAAFEALFGHTLATIVKRSPWSLRLWDDERERENHVTELLAHRVRLQRQTLMRRSDGSSFHAELLLELIEIDGKDHLLLVARDITEHVESEAARAESEEKFLRTFEHSPDGIAIIRLRDGLIYDVNPALVVASGYRKDELLGQSVYALNVFGKADQLDLGRATIDKQARFANLEITFRT
ncbi:MAG: PAS domain S-box protein, partial [Pseudomonadota bacterium]